MKNPRESLPPLSILVVEDDNAARESLGKMIAMKFPDIIIHEAENGTMGVERFKEHAPDIVITDVNMPEMDGIQMAGAIKSMKNDVRFIVLTGYSDEIYKQKFCEIGFCDYIMKPIEFRMLFASIERCIAEITHQGQ